MPTGSAARSCARFHVGKLALALLESDTSFVGWRRRVATILKSQTRQPRAQGEQQPPARPGGWLGDGRPSPRGRRQRRRLRDFRLSCRGPEIEGTRFLSISLGNSRAPKLPPHRGGVKPGDSTPPSFCYQYLLRCSPCASRLPPTPAEPCVCVCVPVRVRLRMFIWCIHVCACPCHRRKYAPFSATACPNYSLPTTERPAADAAGNQSFWSPTPRADPLPASPLLSALPATSSGLLRQIITIIYTLGSSGCCHFGHPPLQQRANL